MGDNILKLDCEVTCDSEEGLEIRLRCGGSIPCETVEHFALAGDELLSIIRRLAGASTGRSQEKVRTKIEIEEA